MSPTVLTVVSAAALVLALIAAVGLAVQSERLDRLRGEIDAQGSDVARMRAELDAVRRGTGPAEVVEMVRSGVPRPRVPTSPTAWRRARAGETARNRRVAR